MAQKKPSALTPEMVETFCQTSKEKVAVRIDGVIVMISRLEAFIDSVQRNAIRDARFLNLKNQLDQELRRQPSLEYHYVQTHKGLARREYWTWEDIKEVEAIRDELASILEEVRNGKKDE